MDPRSSNDNGVVDIYATVISYKTYCFVDI